MSKPFLLVIMATFFISIAQLFYKIGSGFLPVLSWHIFAGFFIYCFSAVLIIVALKFIDMSVVFPAIANSFVWVALLSVFFLGEVLSVVNWVGIVLIVCGVALLGGRQ